MESSLRLLADHLDTAVGRFVLLTDEAGRLRAAGFVDQHARMERLLSHYAGGPAYELVPTANPFGLTESLERYFAGELSALEGLPVMLEGTPFQRQVWEALRTIPCGQTRSYGELARQIGRPTAVRAVGLANGQNPVAVVVPCHRVIGADGSLTGYGGGIERKQWLLNHERRAASQLALEV